MESRMEDTDSLSGPMLRDAAMLLLRYPILRDTFIGRLACSQNGAILKLVLSFTQAHLCDTPFYNVSRDNVAIAPKKTKQAQESFASASGGGTEGGGSFTSILQFSGPFFQCRKKRTFSTLKLAPLWRQPPEAPLEYRCWALQDAEGY